MFGLGSVWARGAFVVGVAGEWSWRGSGRDGGVRVVGECGWWGVLAVGVLGDVGGGSGIQGVRDVWCLWCAVVVVGVGRAVLRVAAPG
ncbi:hypothetical protein GCM10009549_26010 [Streptomyces thermoalcalitolerans]|uniref:Uncharacterized protein n=1 Tax=Streptomyces thermoalcalitolerans TaxID=65605 RepID=A0ABN1NNT0_9ACTN